MLHDTLLLFFARFSSEWHENTTPPNSKNPIADYVNGTAGGLSMGTRNVEKRGHGPVVYGLAIGKECL